MLKWARDAGLFSWYEFVIRQIFLFNHETGKEDENYRKLIASGTVLFLMLFVLVFFSIYNYCEGNLSLSALDAALAVVGIAAYFFFRKTSNVVIISVVTALFMGVAIIFPIYINKAQDFIPLWGFLYPFAAMMMLGHKRGLYFTVICFFVIYLMLFNYLGVNLTSHEYVRYILVSCTLISFSYIYEYTIYASFIRINRSIISINSLNLELKEISRTDGLTRIYNRRYFDRIFPQVLKIAKRGEKLLTFLMIDIDHFKQYNDIYGHQDGDNALKKVALVIKNTLGRPDDYCFRLGGEEFGMLFFVKSEQDGLKIADVVRRNIENLQMEHSGNSASPYITVSIGVYTIEPDHHIPVEEIYNFADSALYRAKQKGRNQIESAC